MAAVGDVWRSPCGMTRGYTPLLPWGEEAAQ